MAHTIAASSHVLALSPKGDTQWVYGVGLIFSSVRTNKRHYHHSCPLYVIWPMDIPETITEALPGPDKP
jgi:hypothetical protein